MMGLSESGPRRWRLLILGLGGAYAAAFAKARIMDLGGRPCAILFDDAMISMRYAQHLAAGQGWVWNVGEAPVEGFSNLLWTLWMALLHWAGLSGEAVSLLVLLSGLACLLGAAWLLSGWRTPEGDARPGLSAAAALLASYPVLFWCGSGLEVGFLLLLACAAFVLLDRPGRPGWACAMLILALWTRPDAVVLAAALLVGAGFFGPREQRLKLGIGALACAVLGVGLPLLWRHQVFGEWEPNTYFLKMTGAPQSWRLMRGLMAYRHFLWTQVPFLGLAGWGLWRHREEAWAGRALLLFGGLSAYSVWVGGDAWESLGGPNRYLVPAMPALLLLAGAGWTRIPGRPLRWLLLVLALGWSHASRGGSWAREACLDSVPQLGTEWADAKTGMELRDRLKPGIRLGVMTAGHLCYWSGHPCLDLLGKSDPAIAKGPVHASCLALGWRGLHPGHDKWDFQRVCAQAGPLWVLQVPHAESAEPLQLLQCGFKPVAGCCGPAYYRP